VFDVKIIKESIPQGENPADQDEDLVVKIIDVTDENFVE
jgi:hypothetical protein